MQIGLDIGGTKMLGLVIDDDPAMPVAVRRSPTVPDPQVLTADAARLVAELESETGGRASTVGVGIAGLVDRDGVLRYAPNIIGVTEYRVRDELSDALGRPVSVDNDATAATWAEARAGAGEGSEHVAYVALGTGIGTGFVLGGRVYRGSNGFAGESGHVVIDRDGPTHHTGARGPWELFASGTALGIRARTWAGAGHAPTILGLAGAVDAISAEHIQAAVEAGAPDALALLDDFARDVGIGAAGLVHVLDPEVVIIGGGLIDLGEPLVDRIRHWTHTNVLGGDHRPAVRVVGARFGSQAAAIGAAMLAAELEA